MATRAKKVVAKVQAAKSKVAKKVAKKVSKAVRPKASGPSKSATGRALSALTLPELIESRTSNGLRVIAAPRGPLPMVSVRLIIQAGSAVEPAHKFGLADFTAQLLRRGTERLSADELNEAVEFVGASLGIGVAEDFMSIRLTTPSEHLPEMMEILGQLVREPRLDAQEIARAKERTIAQLANDLDDPSHLADRATVHAIWGKHPYGHDAAGQKSHVQSFTREDVQTFHRTQWGPKIAMLIGVGQLDPEAFQDAAEKAFGRWEGGPDSPVVLPPLTEAALAGTVVVVDKPEQTQTQVRLGTIAFPKGHPDYFPTYVTNAAFGGGFTSRLVDEVRVKRGLSYGVSSGFDLMKAAGWFGISTFTKTGSTRAILDVILNEAAKLRKSGIKQPELERTQRYLAGLFPLRTETNEAIAGSIAETRLYNLGDDWVERFRERIYGVTLQDANRAARTHFLATAPALVLVGRAQEIADQVHALGPIAILKAAELE